MVANYDFGKAFAALDVHALQRWIERARI